MFNALQCRQKGEPRPDLMTDAARRVLMHPMPGTVARRREADRYRVSLSSTLDAKSSSSLLSTIGDGTLSM
jgi:hypothetical protein